MSQVYHFQNFYVTRLREAVDASSTTIYVDNPPTISSGILVLEGKNASKREIIYFSSVSGYALNDCIRGLEGTTPNTHNQGATIEQAVTAGQLDQVLSPHILLQGLGNDENAAMSQDAVTRVFTKAHNADGTLKDKIATLGKIHGGSTAGVLTTDVSGNVSVKGNYSTSEADTNTKWTNGKTIYQRTFNGSHTTNTTLTLWASSPIDQIVRVEGYATFEGVKNAIPGTRFVGTSTQIYHNVTVSIVGSSNLALYTYGTTSGANTHAITVFYTKV